MRRSMAPSMAVTMPLEVSVMPLSSDCGGCIMICKQAAAIPIIAVSKQRAKNPINKAEFVTMYNSNQRPKPPRAATKTNYGSAIPDW